MGAGGGGESMFLSVNNTLRASWLTAGSLAAVASILCDAGGIILPQRGQVTLCPLWAAEELDRSSLLPRDTVPTNSLATSFFFCFSFIWDLRTLGCPPVTSPGTATAVPSRLCGRAYPPRRLVCQGSPPERSPLLGRHLQERPAEHSMSSLFGCRLPSSLDRGPAWCITVQFPGTGV